MPFASLGLAPEITRAIDKQRFQSPTPVQERAIPVILQGKDIRACAQTGSGKTAAFALPILQNILSTPRKTPLPIRALVLVPTRELALQVNDVFSASSQFLPFRFKSFPLVGGVSVNPQMIALRSGADVVVATPGRLLDLVRKNAIKLDRIETLVLDEADRLLELGFSEEINAVLKLLPVKRQNLLFSATFPDEVLTLADNLLQEAIEIDIAEAPETKLDIAQRAIEVETPRRTQLLRHLVESNEWKQVLVFVASAYSTEHVAGKLRKVGLSTGVLHGKLSQGARIRSLEQFKSGKIHILLCTDLASRGLDIVNLPVVVNYDLPRSTNDFVHRIGRTGRAGASGIAISFVTGETSAHFQLIEKRHGFQITREQVPGFEPVSWELPVPSPTGGIKGKRKSKKDKLREAAALEAFQKKRNDSSNPSDLWD